MADMTPLKSRITFGDYTITQGVTIVTDPLKSQLKINDVTWIGSPTTLLVPPMRTRMSFGRYRWVQHSGPMTTENPLNYNGTRYEVLMTGGHVNLPDLLIPARTIDVEDASHKYESKILAYTPGTPGTPGQAATYRRVVGLVASSDYGADRAVIGATAGSTWVGSVIVTATMTDDPTGNVYSTVLNTGGQRHIFRHLTTGTTSRQIASVTIPFGVPPIHQMRAIPGVGFAASTSGGFYFFSLDLTVMQPRNSGIVDLSGSNIRLSLLTDGSLIVYAQSYSVYASTDLGLRWINVSGNLPTTAMISRDVYVASATHWYLATNLGVYKTTNGGGTWGLVNSNLTPYLGPFVGNTPVGAFSIHGSASNPNIVIVGLRGHVARTTNGGATWAVFGKTEGLSSKVPNYRVHQVGSVLLAAYGQLYEFVPTASIWRSEDNGASWQVAFPGANAMYVNDFASVDDLVVIATPQGIGSPVVDAPGVPGTPGTPPVVIEIGTRVTAVHHADIAVTADVDTATLAGIAARMVTVGGKKARLIVRQVKDYRTQKYYQTIASGEYGSSTHTRSSLAGLVSIALAAQDRDVGVTTGKLPQRVARAIPEEGVVVGEEGEGANIVLSMLIDETFEPGTKISWRGVEYTILGIKYTISDSSRLMSLNSRYRVFAAPTTGDRAGISKEFPVFSPPRVTAKRSARTSL